MKRFVLLFLFNIFILSAQENEIFLMRFHEMEISGNRMNLFQQIKTISNHRASHLLKKMGWLANASVSDRIK